MHRSFAECMGFKWPPGLVYIINGRKVTYAELKAERVAEQKKHLERVLECRGPMRRAAHVWTFFIPGPIYSGWHLYVRTLKDDWWIHENDELVLEIMAMFPCGLLPVRENFYRWKEAFADNHRRGPGCRKQGMIAVWVTLGTNGWPDDVYYNGKKERRKLYA